MGVVYSLEKLSMYNSRGDLLKSFNLDKGRYNTEVFFQIDESILSIVTKDKISCYVKFDSPKKDYKLNIILNIKDTSTDIHRTVILTDVDNSKVIQFPITKEIQSQNGDVPEERLSKPFRTGWRVTNLFYLKRDRYVSEQERTKSDSRDEIVTTYNHEGLLFDNFTGTSAVMNILQKMSKFIIMKAKIDKPINLDQFYSQMSKEYTGITVLDKPNYELVLTEDRKLKFYNKNYKLDKAVPLVIELIYFENDVPTDKRQTVSLTYSFKGNSETDVATYIMKGEAII